MRRVVAPPASPRRRVARMPSAAAVSRGYCCCGYASIYKRLGAIYCNNCGGRIPREGCRIFHGQNEVGFVTSGTFSPTLEKNIAMAYVNSAFAAPGAALDIEVRDVRVSAQVVPLPFYSGPKR